MPTSEFIKITPSGCHEWRGSKFASGYGRIKIHQRTYRAHRFLWECANGPIPEGLYVCHHCDNRLCVRLDHLFLGTHEDNMADMVAKGRQHHNEGKVYLRGEEHHNTKMSDRQVERIRALYAKGGISQQAIADRFGISQPLVSQYVRRVCR